MAEDAARKQSDKYDFPVDIGGQVPRDVEAQWSRQEFSGCTAVSTDERLPAADRPPFEQTDFANQKTEALDGPQELAGTARGCEVHEMPSIAEVPLVEHREAQKTPQELGDNSATPGGVVAHEVQGSEVGGRE